MVNSEIDFDSVIIIKIWTLNIFIKILSLFVHIRISSVDTWKRLVCQSLDNTKWRYLTYEDISPIYAYMTTYANVSPVYEQINDTWRCLACLGMNYIVLVYNWTMVDKEIHISCSSAWTMTHEDVLLTCLWSYGSWIYNYLCRLPETCWEVVSHLDWQTWRSCQTEKYFAGPKKKPPKNSPSCA